MTAARVDCGDSASPLQLADLGSRGVVHLLSALVPVGGPPSTAGDCGSDAAPWSIVPATSPSTAGGSDAAPWSIVPSTTGDCGSDAAPWLIAGHQGQRVRVTLLDFDAHALQPSSSFNDSAVDSARYRYRGQIYNISYDLS